MGDSRNLSIHNDRFIQDHHAASALGAVPGLPVSVFSATAMDNAPYLAGLVPVDSEKIVHPKVSPTSQQAKMQTRGLLKILRTYCMDGPGMAPRTHAKNIPRMLFSITIWHCLLQNCFAKVTEEMADYIPLARKVLDHFFLELLAILGMAICDLTIIHTYFSLSLLQDLSAYLAGLRPRKKVKIKARPGNNEAHSPAQKTDE